MDINIAAQTIVSVSVYGGFVTVVMMIGIRGGCGDEEGFVLGETKEKERACEEREEKKEIACFLLP